MNRALLIAAVCLAVCAWGGPAWGADEGVQILLLSTADTLPGARAVQGLTEEQLESFHVWVEIAERETIPESTDDWIELARTDGRQQAGTLAVIGWRCGKQRCRLFIIETRQLAVVELAVPRSDDDAQTTAALAAVIREALLGTLLPELFRLSAEGREPTEPPDLFGDEPAGELASDADLPEPRRWLWVEGGYHGEYPYPGSRALHGPWLGLSLAAGRHLIPRLTVGWLGLQRAGIASGELVAHRLPVVLGLRLALPVGAATFSLMPAVRLDIVFAETDPVAPAVADASSTDPELHLGGVFDWRLPLIAGLDAVLGAGLYGSVLSRRYLIDDAVVLARSKMRIVWTAGIAWSPI